MYLYKLLWLSDYYTKYIYKQDEKILQEAAKSYSINAKAEMYKLPAMYVGEYAERDAEATLKLWQRLNIAVKADW